MHTKEHFKTSEIENIVWYMSGKCLMFIFRMFFASPSYYF